MDDLQWTILIKMDDFGVAPFQETSRLSEKYSHPKIMTWICLRSPKKKKKTSRFPSHGGLTNMGK